MDSLGYLCIPPGQRHGQGREETFCWGRRAMKKDVNKTEKRLESQVIGEGYDSA